MHQPNNHSYRQVHLDFHTSPDIPGIGLRFSKENFQEALKRGNVDSITVFAKCHHGVCYYPTEIGTMHPQLSFDLTGAMVDAAHEIGVKAPIYITAGWSDLDATQHPEWIAVDRDGNPMARGGYKYGMSADTPKPYTSWQILCLNDNGYARHIYELTEEVCRRYPVVDGLFYDITVVGGPCYCGECREGMAQMGLDPESEVDAERYFVVRRQVFMQKCNDILQRYHPGATIFFNAGGANMKLPEYHALQSHFEMEDLPTAWGGYDKLPLRAKFFKATGKHIVGMTGKFHLDWGEFGGFKTPEALKYEIATMALYGAAASVGDHMHPDGEMELQTYETIGYAYDYLEKIAPYCYFPGHRIAVREGQVLAHLITPYFSRTYGHFCGYKNTPHEKSSEHLPAIVKNGNVVYLAHSLPKNYFVKGSVYHKRWFMQALNEVFTPKLQVSGLGAQGRCTMIHQSEQKRFCINMTYASPVRRGEAEIIEDILPVFNIDVRLKTEQKITAVCLPLSGETLKFSQEGATLSFTIPELNCHTTVTVEYE